MKKEVQLTGDLQGEVWMPISGYLNYLVSNMGRIMVLQTNQTYIERGNIKSRIRKQRVLSPKLRGNRVLYYFVNLTNCDGRKAHVVHRLVAKAFIDNPLNKPCVNHIDNNPLNNIASNLEWCTQSENMQHCFAQNRHPSQPLYQWLAED